jgi:hypothetical protein
VVELVAGICDKKTLSREEIMMEEVREESGYQTVESIKHL